MSGYTATITDGIASRGREHLNLVLIPGERIQEFQGESIPPAVRVLSTSYTKNGKWSHTTWKIWVDEDCCVLEFSQDWGTGRYFPTETWPESVAHLNRELKGKPTEMGITPGMLEEFIRIRFPKVASRLDEAEAAWNAATKADA